MFSKQKLFLSVKKSTALAALAVSLAAVPTFAQVYKAPEYDFRFLFETGILKQRVQKFYNLNLGDTIRLGEYSCGDPRFIVNLNVVPTFVTTGTLRPDGTYNAKLEFSSGANAKIYETCFGLEQPSVGGTFNLSATAGRVTDVDKIRLEGNFYLSPLQQLFGKGYPIQTEIALPVESLRSIPINLKNDGAVSLDFGALNGMTWTTAGQTKNVPVVFNFGSFGGSTTNTSFLAVDATIGQQRFRDWPTANAAKMAFEGDVPVWQSRNLGLSARPSLFGTYNTISDARKGLFGQLLPLRISGDREAKILWWKRTYHYEVVVDGAETSIAQDGQKPIFKSALSTSYAFIQRVKNVNGAPVLGKKKVVKNVKVSATFSDLRTEKESLVFNVADFRLAIKFWNFIIPVRLPTELLAQSLNNGKVSLGGLRKSFLMVFPDCLDAKEVKFKAGAGKCGHPSQRIGSLSLESSNRGTLFATNPASFDFRIDQEKMQLSGSMTASDAPDVDQVVSQAANLDQETLFHLRYVRTDAAPAGEGQCGDLVGGNQYARVGDWLGPIRLDTDDDPGGCDLSFGFIDPKNNLAGLKMKINFYPDDEGVGQCGNPGSREVPARQSLIGSDSDIPRSTPMRIDTDKRYGGCREVYSIEGSDKFELDIGFWADGDANQCGGAMAPDKWITAALGKPAEFRLDMDNRTGGCNHRFRLRMK